MNVSVILFGNLHDCIYVSCTFSCLDSLQWNKQNLFNLCTVPQGDRYKLSCPVGPEPENVAYIFVFLGSIIICRWYKLILSDQAQVPLQLGLSDLS